MPGLSRADGYWTRYFQIRRQWRPQAGPHQDRRRCIIDRVLHLGRLGFGRQPSGRRLLLYQQLSVRSRRRQSADLRCPAVERLEPARIARRHRHRAAGVRQIRSTWLDHPRPAHPPPGDSGESERRAACVGEILRGGRPAVPRTDPGRAGSPTTAPIPAVSTASPGNDLPSNLLRTWHLQTAIFWIATAYVAAALFLGRSLRSMSRVGSQPPFTCCSRLSRWSSPPAARRMAGHIRSARRVVCLVRQPGLGVPGDRPLLQYLRVAGCRPVRDSLVGCAAAHGGQSQARPLARGSCMRRWRSRCSTPALFSAPGPTSPSSTPGASGSSTCG